MHECDESAVVLALRSLHSRTGGRDYGALVTFVHDPAGVLLHFCQWDSA